jgi:hypothetical protein
MYNSNIRFYVHRSSARATVETASAAFEQTDPGLYRTRTLSLEADEFKAGVTVLSCRRRKPAVLGAKERR